MSEFDGRPGRSLQWLYAGEIALLTLAATLTVHVRITESLWTPEASVSVGLLAYNFLLAVAMLGRKGPDWLGGAMGFGLLLIVAKVFVNTFTILLLIGLQAVRTPVFIPVFFTGYFVLLSSSIWALHRTHQVNISSLTQ